MTEELKKYKKILCDELSNSLPGKSAHDIMYPKTHINLIANRHTEPPKKSSVMIVLFPYNGFLKTVVILRSEYDGVHSKQISFPGGKYEKSDTNLINTAIRETKEEISLHIDKDNIIGKLTDIYIPPSNFIVAPYVAIIDSLPKLKKDPIEVEKIIEVDLNEIIKCNSITSHKVYSLNSGEIIVPCFKNKNNIIWGATAMILSELREILLKLN
ncbi:MAG: CoA pyrophosphatase [Bacteroidota bacterium]|nr:CoA pyrophosphatase [Bacteroidota bacterium]